MQIAVPSATQWPEIRHTELVNDSVTITVGASGAATVVLVLSGKVTINVELQHHAVLTVLCLQTQQATVHQHATVGDNASIRWQNISLAAGTWTLASSLTGRHAVSDIDWIFYAHKDERQELSACNTFEAGDGGGEITMKGVAEGSAHVQCNGFIAIGLNGGGTDTYLTENVLMLDPTAKVDAIPGLEIKTNDVKASHSATVSRVTADDLFYFGSRGLDTVSARRMYIAGFLQDLTQRIVDTDARAMVLDAIEEKWMRVMSS